MDHAESVFAALVDAIALGLDRSTFRPAPGTMAPWPGLPGFYGQC